MLVLSATLQLVQMHNLCSLLRKLAEVCLSVYRVLFFQITTQKIRHLELQYCTFFTLLLYTCKLHELILLDFLPSCYILDNQVILPGKCFLPPTCPGTSFVKNICRTLGYSKMTEKRRGPAPGVRLIEVSVKRELTVQLLSNFSLNQRKVSNVQFQKISILPPPPPHGRFVTPSPPRKFQFSFILCF